jgi:hypothetical protein
VRTTGVPPSPRGGHTAVVYRDSLYAFGGKSGRSPFNDLCALDFERGAWAQVRTVAPVPAPRCAHVCVAHGSSLYVFGGYDGRRYFDDCYAFSFEPAGPNPATALSLAGDLAQMVNNPQFADIEFALDDGRCLCAHKSILFARSDYFRKMLTGGYREAADARVQIGAARERASERAREGARARATARERASDDRASRRPSLLESRRPADRRAQAAG